MSLPAAYVVALAMHCAPLVAPETLVSIAQTESRLDPLAIRDNTTGKVYTPATVEAASTQAEGLIRAGHSVDLGLMQINSANLHLAGLSVFQSFKACYALAAGARLLAQGYSGGVTVDEQQRALRVALSRYNTGDPLRGFENGYVGRVVSAAQQVVPAIQVPEPALRLQGSRNTAASAAPLQHHFHAKLISMSTE
jgi:type IV secretion system protein VirB1